MQSAQLLLEDRISVETALSKNGKNVLYVPKIQHLYVPGSESTDLISLRFGKEEKIFENIGTPALPKISFTLSKEGRKINVIAEVFENSKKTELFIDKKCLASFVPLIEEKPILAWNNKNINTKEKISKDVVDIIFENQDRTKLRLPEHHFKNFENSKKLIKKIKEESKQIYKVKSIEMRKKQVIEKRDTYNYLLPIEERKVEKLSYVEIFKKEQALKKLIENRIAVRVDALQKLFDNSKNRISCLIDNKNKVLEIKHVGYDSIFHFFEGIITGNPVIERNSVSVTLEVTGKEHKYLKRIEIDSKTGKVLGEEVLSVYDESPIGAVKTEAFYSSPSISKQYNVSVDYKKRSIRVFDILEKRVVDIPWQSNEILTYQPYFNKNTLVINIAKYSDIRESTNSKGYIYETRTYEPPSFDRPNIRVSTIIEQFQYFQNEKKYRAEDYREGSDTGGDFQKVQEYPFMLQIDANLAESTYISLIAADEVTGIAQPITRIQPLGSIQPDDSLPGTLLNPPSGYVNPPVTPDINIVPCYTPSPTPTIPGPTPTPTPTPTNLPHVHVTLNNQNVFVNYTNFNLYIGHNITTFNLIFDLFRSIKIKNNYDFLSLNNCNLSGYNFTKTNMLPNPVNITNSSVISTDLGMSFTLSYVSTSSPQLFSSLANLSII